MRPTSSAFQQRIANNKGICIIVLIVATFCISHANGRAPQEPYYGRYIGNFTEFAHKIKGDVYAVDESTIFIKGFAYDGTGPDAFFWVGKTARPSPDGFLIPYPEEYSGREPPILQAHNNTDIILRLPMGKRIRDIRWLSVWCRRFTVDFGEVFIPVGLDVPKPRVLPEFKRLAHGLRSSNISVLDAKTFYIPNLHYDGAGPDAYFWVGNGSEPNIMGIKFYNGHQTVHALKYQSVMLPNGIIAHLYGPVNGRRHDGYILAKSRIIPELELKFHGVSNPPYLYSDTGYPLKKHLIVPFRAPLTRRQKTVNTKMSKLRVTVEWGFGKIIQIFPFLDFKKNLKVYKQRVADYYKVGAILTNCHTCLYGNQVSEYFECYPPNLNEYLQ